jgi:hypothetical protein
MVANLLASSLFLLLVLTAQGAKVHRALTPKLVPAAIEESELSPEKPRYVEADGNLNQVSMGGFQADVKDRTIVITEGNFMIRPAIAHVSQQKKAGMGTPEYASASFLQIRASASASARFARSIPQKNLAPAQIETKEDAAATVPFWDTSKPKKDCEGCVVVSRLPPKPVEKGFVEVCEEVHARDSYLFQFL